MIKKKIHYLLIPLLGYFCVPKLITGTDFFSVIKNGEKAVENLITQQGIDQKDKQGNTLLDVAIESSHLTMINFLLKKKADVTKIKQQNTEKIIENIGSIDYFDDIAIQVLTSLLAKNRIDLKGEEGQKVLVGAMKSKNGGEGKLLKWILSKKEIDWSLSKKEVVNQLFKSLLEFDFLELIFKLLKKKQFRKKLDFDATNQDSNGMTLLELLIEKTNNSKDSAESREEQLINILKLLDKKKVISLKGKEGQKSILLAVQYRKMSLFQFLYDEYFNIEDWSSEDITQLFTFLIKSGNITKSEELLKEKKFKDKFYIDEPGQNQENFLSALLDPSLDSNKIKQFTNSLISKDLINVEKAYGKKMIFLAAKASNIELLGSLRGVAQLHNWKTEEISELFLFTIKVGSFKALQEFLNENYFIAGLNLEAIDQTSNENLLSLLIKYFSKHTMGPQKTTNVSLLEILKLLDQKEIIQLAKEDGKTVTLLAARYGLIKDAKLFYQQYFKSEHWKTEDVNLLFQYLGQYGEFELIKELLSEKPYLKNSFDINSADKTTNFLSGLMSTSFHSIASEEEKQIKVLELLDTEGKIELKGEKGRIALQVAAQYGKRKMVKFLYEKKDIIVWDQWEQEKFDQFVIYIAENPMTNIINKLLNDPIALKKLDISKKDKNGKTFLWHLIKSNTQATLAILKELKEKGKISEIDKNKLIFLDACATDSRTLVGNALKAGIDLNTKDDKQRTGMMIAALNGHQITLKTLAEQAGELKPEYEDQDGMNLLLLGAKSQITGVVKTLLSFPYNFNINFQSKKTGQTALMVVASRKERFNRFYKTKYSTKYPEEKDLTMAKFLIKNNANIHLRDKNNKTAYDLAKDAGNEMIVKYFEKILPKIPIKIPNNDNQRSKYKYLIMSMVAIGLVLVLGTLYWYFMQKPEQAEESEDKHSSDLGNRAKR